MTELRSDILVEVPDDQLPKLGALYQEKAPWAPFMVSFIHIQIKWKKSDKYKGVTTIYSPNNSWQEDGTIISITRLYGQDIVVFTLDDSCSNLYKGLKETTLIKYHQRILFFCIHEKHVPAVLKCLEEKKVVNDPKPSFIYAVSPQEGKDFAIECPSDVYIERLKPSAAKEINDVWPHKFQNSEEYVSTYIDINGGYGIFLKSTDELIAWAMKYTCGNLGLLQTKDNYKRKGYASLVAKVLSKDIAEEGIWPVGTVLVNNVTSINMFEKMGFHRIGLCTYIIIE